MIGSRGLRAGVVSLVILSFFVALAPPAHAVATTRRISVTSTGAQADYGGNTPGISADGRYIAYRSDATNLVPGGGDTNNSLDVFVYDRSTRQVVRVSVKPDGSQGFPPYPATFGDLRPSLSADGRFVAFSSFLELVPGDTNQQPDIYVHDRDADEDGVFDEAGAIDTVRVSVASDGTQATPYSNYFSDISADGRYVTFASDCNNLVPGDTNGRRDVFVHDRDTDGDGLFDEPGAIATRMVSVSTDGSSPGNEESTVPRMSADGRYVSFIGGANNLVAGDLNGRWDVFVRDRDTDQDGLMDEPGASTTFRASVQPNGDAFDVNVNYGHDISAEGSWVGFEVPSAPSGAVSNLLYAFDIETRTSQFVKNLGSTLTGRTLAISGDGSSIVTNEGSSVVLVDRATAATETISVYSGGSPAPGDSVALSDDAGFVGFSSSQGLVPGDSNNQSDVFLRDRNAPPLAAPTAPTDVVAVAGDHSATVSWTAPDDGGSPLQYYTITVSPPDVGPLIINPTTSTTITGLTSGATYTFSLTATNSVGTGPPGVSNPVTPTGVQRYELDVSVDGNGSGSVSSAPGGIDCGPTCSADFDDGTDVTLSAMPQLGSTFDGWSGAGCSGVDDCVVTMDQARSVTATFSTLPSMTTRLTDDFDGTSLDAAAWDTSIATGGVRWCASAQANHLTASGLWQDVSSQACHGLIASAPHGAISVSGGAASFSAGARRTFPYVWRGQPSRSSPFPADGAFVLEVRMRFDSLAPSGTEFHVGDWANTDPSGDNPPGNLVFAIGACSACGLVTNLLGVPSQVPGSDTAFHDYRLEYVNGRYSLWVDGVRTMGPVASSVRPNAIWIGNPVFTHWVAADWTDLTLDSVLVSAEQPSTHQLDVTKNGSGGGSVHSTPAGIDCGPTCSASFDDGMQVTLTATADANSSFSGWSGAGCSGTGDCVVTMDQARSVTATFSAPATISVDPSSDLPSVAVIDVSGTGLLPGEVVQLQQCSSIAHTCTGIKSVTADASGSFATTLTVRLDGYGWFTCQGDCSVQAVATSGPFAGQRRGSAQTISFASAQHQLDVTKDGNGGGTVTSTPTGIDCGPACSASFDDGTQVTLTAAANANSTFTGWSGSGCSGTGDCVVTLDQARSVTATFSKNTHPLDVTKDGNGGGTVTSTPTGIDCGPTCSASFDDGTQVTLTAAANANSTFTGWSGSGCSGTGDCVVTLDQARSVTATFASADADLGVIHAPAAQPIVASTFTYLIQVANDGPATASNVTLVVELSPNVVFLATAAGQGACSHTGGTVTCSVGALASGVSWDVTVDVIPIAAGTITNVASVSASEQDPVLSNNSSSLTRAATGTSCTIVGTQGNDTLTGTAGSDVICGLAGADYLTGVSSADVLIGGDGDDVILGGSGGDSLLGGAGADNLIGAADDDFLFGGAGNDALSGGAGTDYAQYDDAPSGVTASLTTNTATGGDGNDTFAAIEGLAGSAFADSLSGDGGSNPLYGRAGNDTLSGMGGGDALVGEAGNDTLDGGAGNGDALVGEAGDDTLDGGAGNGDAAQYDNAPSGVTASLTTNTATGGAGTDTFVPNTIEGLMGSAFADNLTGDGGANDLWGRAGNDILSALAGSNDHLFGEAGDDTLDGGAGADLAQYDNAPSGVTASLTTNTATGGAGTDTFVPNTIEGLMGSAFADSLTGNDAGNPLHGFGGNDSLTGLGGGDSLVGGDGNDMILAGDGNDLLIGDAGNDVLDGGAGNNDQAVFPDPSSGVGVVASLTTNTATGGSGTGSDTFAPNTIEALGGSPFADTLTGDGGANALGGGDGNDTISGQGGSDTVTGGNGDDSLLGDAGNDFLYGGAGNDALNGGGGTDYAQYDNAPSGVTASLTTNTATGGDGNDTFAPNTIEGLAGSAFADSLSGDGGSNLLYGRAGNDTLSGMGGGDGLFGEAGDDTLDGGAGNGDAAQYDNAPSGVTASLTTNTATGGAGTDTFTPNTIEHLVGSAFADSLTGDGGANDLWGRAGNDILSGQGGGDTLHGEAGNDSLLGDVGNDYLFGEAGSDTLDGGAGNNDYAQYDAAPVGVTASLTTNTTTGGDGNDTFVPNTIEGLAGSAFADNLTGDAGGNPIYGRAGDDILSGLGGADALFGEDGNDTLQGGAGNDTLDGGNGSDNCQQGTGTGSPVNCSP